MGLFDLFKPDADRKPMTVPGDDFHSYVTPTNKLVTKYKPGDSNTTYTEVKNKHRTTTYISRDN